MKAKLRKFKYIYFGEGVIYLSNALFYTIASIMFLSIKFGQNYENLD